MKNIIIREEKETDWYETEYMTKRAFWNLHVPGCNEHYLVHKLRNHKDYIPELSRVAEADGKIVGTIMYSKAYIINEEKKTEILTFGPLCIDPDYQNKGIGKKLLEVTMKLAKDSRYRAVVIFGEPGYYPKHGFKSCDNFNITTKDGSNFDAFMGIELITNGLKGVTGKYFESEVFDDNYLKESDEYDMKFPYLEKLILPGQWK